MKYMFYSAPPPNLSLVAVVIKNGRRYEKELPLGFWMMTVWAIFGNISGVSTMGIPLSEEEALIRWATLVKES